MTEALRKQIMKEVKRLITSDTAHDRAASLRRSDPRSARKRRLELIEALLKNAEDGIE